MALQKQTVNVNFGQGLDQKTDPLQLPIGKFLAFDNTVYDTLYRLTKRNGFGSLAALPDSSYSFLTTFNKNLTAIGTNLAAYSSPTQTWISKGLIQPLSLSALPLIRSNANQSQVDCAISASGLVCSVYTEAISQAGAATSTTVTSYKYAIADATTGQNIVAPTVIVSPSVGGTVTGSPRIFLLGNYFLIVFPASVSAVEHLQYLAINTSSFATSSADITSSYTTSTSSPNVAFDGVVASSILYLAWNGGAVSGIKMTTIDANLSIGATTNPDPNHTTDAISVCADTTQSPVQIWVSYHNLLGVIYTFAVNPSLAFLMAPLKITVSSPVRNVASAAQNGTNTIFADYGNPVITTSVLSQLSVAMATVTPLSSTFQSVFSSAAGTITASSATGLVNGMYLVDNTTPTNLPEGVTFTVSGTTLTLSANTTGNSASSPGDTMKAVTVVNSGSDLLRGVGLGSKAFIFNSQIYVLTAYSSVYQPTYFLINTSGQVIAKLAYSNGGGYLSAGLPAVTVDSTSAKIPYLIKDFLQAINKNAVTSSGTPNPTPGVYSQTGINIGTFTFGTSSLSVAEIANNLHLNGGFLWMFDGYLPVEHNFFLWPDFLSVTTTAGTFTRTATRTSGSAVLTAVSSVADLAYGMSVSGTGIPANTYIVSFTSNTITLNKSATSSAAGGTYTFTGNISTAQTYYYIATYEWSDNQGNIFRSAPSIPVAVTTTGTTSYNSIIINTLRATYKTANPVKVVLYRWSQGNPTYYQATQITTPLLNVTTADTVSITDALPDSSTNIPQVVGNNILYTTGGVVENIGAPSFKAVSLFNSRLMGIEAENRNNLWYSKQVVPGAPVDMSDLFTYSVPPTQGTDVSTGGMECLFPMDDKEIIFKERAIEYLTGQGPNDLGQQNDFPLSPTVVTATVGCSNQRSIVSTPIGLMFEFGSEIGNQIWLLGRDLSTKYIGFPVQTLSLSDSVKSAIRIPGTTQVRFMMNSGKILMYDYFVDQWGTFSGAAGISSVLYNGLHTFINSSGLVFRETPGTYLDGASPVLISFTSSWIALGGIQGFQKAYWAFLLGQYKSPYKLNVSIAYDFASSASQSLILVPNDRSANAINEWQIGFKKSSCQSFQISVAETYDATIGPAAGAGLTLSGMELVVGVRKGYPRQLPVAQKAG